MLTKKPGEVVNTSSLLQELSKAQAILKLSDRAVAQKIGVSNAYISLIKRGERRLTPAILQKIIAILPDLQSTSMSSLNFSTPVFAYTTIADMRLIGKTSLKPLFDEFLVAKQVEGKSTATLDFYRQNLERFLWWAQQNNVPQEVQKIQARDLRSFLYYVQITPNRWQIGSTSSRHLPSMATVDAYWRTLQGFFSWLVNEGNIKSEANPMRKLPRPKVPRKIVQDIPLNLIRQALDQWDKNTLTGARNRAILLMLLDTGIRLSECANLTTADINLENGSIKIWGKGGKQRLVRVGKTASKALRHYLTLRGFNITDKLWLSEAEKPFTKIGIQSMIRRLEKLGGNVRWSPHTFRNTFAVNYIRRGGDPFTLQILGGWEDLEMPRHYAAALKVEDAFVVHQKASPADLLVL